MFNYFCNRKDASRKDTLQVSLAEYMSEIHVYILPLCLHTSDSSWALTISVLLGVDVFLP